MASVEEYVRSLPPITKYYLFGSLATTVLVTFRLLDPVYLYLDWSLVIHKFQIWRLVTNLLYFGTFSMNMIFQLVLLVRYFNLVETQYYTGLKGTADMIVMLCIGIASLYTFSTFVGGFYFCGPAVVFFMLYIWSRKNPHQQVEFYGFAFHAWHFPFVMILLAVLLGGSPQMDIAGILAGHIYHFFADIVPRVYGITLIKTPEFVYKLLERKQIIQPVRPSWASSSGHSLR